MKFCTVVRVQKSEIEFDYGETNDPLPYFAPNFYLQNAFSMKRFK